RVLQDAIDELREVFQWQSRNPQVPIQSAPVVQSMALSPGVADWAEKLTLSSGVPAIVEQRIAAQFQNEINRLHELLAELSDCPELDPGSNLAPVTQRVLAEVDAVLNNPIELPEPALPPEQETSKSNQPKPDGQLF
ncbi:MAG: hypothetical protein AB8G99_26795, partial [Planctomycetaceae bacterium]